MEFGQVHHIEYYVNDINRSSTFWAWFMEAMGYTKSNEWDGGISWSHRTGTYLVFVQAEKKYLNVENTRQGNGLNHIAFMGGTLKELDELKTIDLKDRFSTDGRELQDRQ